MEETFEQVGLNTSSMGFMGLAVVVILLLVTVIQRQRTPERPLPTIRINFFVAIAVLFGILIVTRVPDFLVIIWLPIAVATGGAVGVLLTKDSPLGHRLGCGALLFLLFIPVSLTAAFLLNRSRATLVLGTDQQSYRSDRVSADLVRANVRIHVVQVTKNKYVLELSDGLSKVPISSRFLFRTKNGKYLSVDELQRRIQIWLPRRK